MRAATLLSVMCLLSGCPPGGEESGCRATPIELDFGEVEPSGALSQRTVSVFNATGKSQLYTAHRPGAPFTVFPLQAQIPPGSSRDFTVTFTPPGAQLHHDELIISTEKSGACNLKLPLRGLGKGQVSVSRAELEFKANVGAPTSLELLLINSRRAAALVTRLEISTPLSSTPFSVTAPEGMRIPARSSLPLTVTATPRTWQFETASLIITTDPLQTISVPLTLVPNTPLAEFSPVEFAPSRVGIDLGSQPLGYAERRVRVRNAGTSRDASARRLTVSTLSIVALDGPESDLKIAIPQELTSGIGEGESTEIVLRIEPRTPGPRRYVLSFLTNAFVRDPTTVTFSSLAEALLPCSLQVAPSSQVQLLPVADGGVEGAVSFSNPGGSRCTVDDLRLTLDSLLQYRIIGGPDQLDVAAGETRQVIIAGPRPASAGRVGAFGFHVFAANGTNQTLELSAVP